MKKKIRFNELKIGDQFECFKRTLKKTSERRGKCLSSHQEFIFSFSDMVLIEVEEIVDDFGDICQGFGQVVDPYFSYSWNGTKQNP